VTLCIEHSVLGPVRGITVSLDVTVASLKEKVRSGWAALLRVSDVARVESRFPTAFCSANRVSIALLLYRSLSLSLSLALSRSRSLFLFLSPARVVGAFRWHRAAIPTALSAPW
jgi:hypothetical protein